jgi:hypothetical protein
MEGSGSAGARHARDEARAPPGLDGWMGRREGMREDATAVSYLPLPLPFLGVCLEAVRYELNGHFLSTTREFKVIKFESGMVNLRSFCVFLPKKKKLLRFRQT